MTTPPRLEDWPWPTLDAWCRDFEDTLKNAGYRILERAPGDNDLGARGYIYNMRKPDGRACGAWIPEGIASTHMPRTTAAAMFLSSDISLEAAL